MKITKSKLQRIGACQDAIDKYFSVKKSYEVQELFKIALGNEDYSNIRWGLSRLMTHQQRIKWSIYCASSVLANYEKQSDNDAPRKAIKATKNYLKALKSNDKEKISHAANEADRAASAAYSAARAARVAYVAYVDRAACAADSVACAACAAYAAYAKTQKKLLTKGLTILLELP